MSAIDSTLPGTGAAALCLRWACTDPPRAAFVAAACAKLGIRGLRLDVVYALTGDDPPERGDDRGLRLAVLCMTSSPATLAHAASSMAQQATIARVEPARQDQLAQAWRMGLAGFWVDDGSAEADILLASEVDQVVARLMRQREADAMEQLRRSMSEVAGVGGWEYDAALGGFRWTEEMRRMHHLPPGVELSAAEFSTLYAKEDVDRFDAALRAALRDGEGFEFDLQASTPTGPRHMRLRGVPRVSEEHGRIIVRGSCQDVTLQHQAREALSAERERLGRILAATGAGTWEWDLSTGGLTVDARFLEVAGVQAGELEPRIAAWNALIHPEDVSWARAHMVEHLKHHTDRFECEFRVRHATGRYIWVRDSGRVFSRDARGRALAMSGARVDVTERKHTELALRETSDAFSLQTLLMEQVLDSLDQGVTKFNPDGRLEFHNRRAAKILNLSDDVLRKGVAFGELVRIQYLSGDFMDLPPGLTMEEAIHFYDLDPGDESRVYLRRTRDDRYIEVSARRIYDGSEVRTYSDVTPYVRARKALVDEQSKLDFVLSSTRASTWVWDTASGQVELDEHWGRMLGYALSEVAYSRFDDWRAMIHPDDLLRMQPLLDEVVGGQADSYEIDFRIRHKDGRWVWVLSRGSLMLHHLSGSQGRFFSGIHLDITSRKQAEAALAEQRVLLDRTLDNLSQGVVYVSPEGRVSKFNDRVAALLHLPTDFLRQQPTFHEFMRFQLERGDFGPHGELLPKSVRAVVWESQDGGLSFSPNEYLRETKEGRILEVRTRRLDSGAYVRTFADVTDYVRAEREIRHLNESLELRVAERTADLERSMKDMEAISYSIAHDLRAPLRSVNGFATLIEQDEGDRLSANARDMFRRITLSASAMGRMIDDLLGLFRVMRAEPADDPVDMQALARTVADSLAPAWPKARVRVGALPPVRGDATLLRQLWSNLIDNALKYSAKSDEPRVEAGYHGPSRAYYVRDNGIGFDMAYAKKIFGVFQRMTVDQEGSGVGLAIVARIVERHAGRIWAQAVPGEGATFWFTIDSEAPSAQP